MATTIDNFILRFKTEGADGIKNASRDLSALGDSAGIAGNSLGGLAGRLTGVASIAVTAAGAFGALGLKAINMADALSDLSNSSGVSASKLLSLKSSMMAAGGDADSYQKAVTKLAVATGEAMSGNDKYIKSFRDLGVYVTDGTGRVRDGNDILDDTIAALAKIEDPAIRAARAYEILGKEAAKIDWSNVSAGKDAITDEQIKQLAKYRDEIDKVIAQFEKGLIKYFGDLATTVNSGGIDAGLAKITEQVSKLAGTILNLPTDAIRAGWNSLVPDFLKIDKAMGLGDPLLELAKKAEEARRAVAVGGGRGGQGGPTAEQLASVGRATLAKPGGGFPVGDKEKAATIESAKRTAQNIADAQKEIALRSASEIEKIDIEMRANIAKAQAEIVAKENLSEVNKAKETLSMVQKETEKAATARNKFLQEQNKKSFEVEQSQREENARAQAEYDKQVEQSQLQAYAQVDAYKRGNDELTARFGLQKSILDLGTIEQERATRLFEIERDRVEELRKIGLIKDLPNDERIKKEEELNKLIADRIALINQEYDTRQTREQDYAAGFKDSLRRYEESFTPIKQGGMMAESIFNNMNDAIDRFATTGKFKFGDFARSIIQDMIKIELKAMASGLLRGLLGSLFGGGGSTGVFGGAVLGLPGFAAGGPTDMSPMIVGERGPELFIPGSAGRIVPNNQLGNNQPQQLVTNVNYRIEAVDASSFRQLVARDPQFIYSVTEKGRRSVPTRR
jgi:lambda family phage tail tape measure protein